MLLTDLGGHDVQDPPAQDPQLPRPEVGCLRDQVGLGGREDLGPDLLGRQLVQRMADHPRLGQIHLTATQRDTHLGPAAVQRLGQGEVAPVGTEVPAGVMGQERGHVPSTLGQRDIVGGRHQPQPQGSELGLHLSEPQHRVPLVTGIHEHHLDVGGLLQCDRHRVGARQHRVHRSTIEDRTHHAPPAPTTDHWVSRVDAARL